VGSEECSQAKHEAMERGEIRGAMSRATNDKELMPEQQRFRGDGRGATRAEEFRKRDNQVDRQEEQISHEPNVITPAPFRKTTR
jgi:hypothetical protein